MRAPPAATTDLSDHKVAPRSASIAARASFMNQRASRGPSALSAQSRSVRASRTSMRTAPLVSARTSRHLPSRSLACGGTSVRPGRRAPISVCVSRLSRAAASYARALSCRSSPAAQSGHDYEHVPEPRPRRQAVSHPRVGGISLLSLEGNCRPRRRGLAREAIERNCGIQIGEPLEQPLVEGFVLYSAPGDIDVELRVQADRKLGCHAQRQARVDLARIALGRNGDRDRCRLVPCLVPPVKARGHLPPDLVPSHVRLVRGTRNVVHRHCSLIPGRVTTSVAISVSRW